MLWWWRFVWRLPPWYTPTTWPDYHIFKVLSGRGCGGRGWEGSIERWRTFITALDVTKGEKKNIYYRATGLQNGEIGKICQSMPSTTRIYKHPWKEKLTEIQDRLITTCQTWFVSCLISKGDFYQFIHLWDRLIVYSRLVPQNIWASQGGISIKHWAFYNWHPLVYNLRINTMRICYLLIRVLRMFGVRVMVKRCESDDSKMWEWWISFWRRKRRGKAGPG